MIIDTHSHLNFKAYDNDREEVIRRTKEADVFCIDVGTKFETSQRAVELAQKYPNIFASIGMHPIHIKSDLLKLRTDENEGAFMPIGEEFNKEEYKKLASLKPGGRRRVVAIGEIGLDYYYKPKGKSKLEEFKKLQKEVFGQQLEMAEELNLPVIVHSRMAYKDTYEMLKSKPGLKGVLHCFVGTVEEMKSYLDLGFYIGINGIIDKLDLDEVVKQCPMDKILTETDCPYLTPKAEGDKRNEPIFVKHIIQKIADLKGLNFKETAEATAQNAKNLFGI